MELDKYITFKIKNSECEFRTLNEFDVTHEYIEALEEKNEFIENIPANLSISSQKQYINEILSRENETICGMFIERELVASCGIQTYKTFLYNIDKHELKVGTMGIFFFSKKYRKLGLGKVLVWASTLLLYECFQAEWFIAGMLKHNIASLKTFLDCGFKQVELSLSQKNLISSSKNVDESIEVYNVLLNYSELIKPKIITCEKIRNVV